MQLTVHTDYALRTLIILGLRAPEKITVREISEAYGISENHLVKVVGTLTSLGYAKTIRGKDGGVRLAMDPQEIVLGELVQQVEPELGVVTCLRTGEAPCIISPACTLKEVLAEATARFIDVLMGYRLSDLLTRQGPLSELLQLSPKHTRPANSPRAPR